MLPNDIQTKIKSLSSFAFQMDGPGIDKWEVTASNLLLSLTTGNRSEFHSAFAAEVQEYIGLANSLNWLDEERKNEVIKGLKALS